MWINKIINRGMNNIMQGNQINMEFFNDILNTTQVLVKKDPDTAYKILEDMSKYLEYQIQDQKLRYGLVKFSQEVEIVKAYINMKKVILGDWLTVVWVVERDDFLIPSSIIQPLVENAIEHGIEKNIEGGTVCIAMYESGGYYIVTITDDGMGFKVKKNGRYRGNTTSLTNIKNRLTAYGNNSMVIKSALGQGTSIRVQFQKRLE